MEENSFREPLSTYGDALSRWWSSVDHPAALAAIVFCAAVLVFRRALAMVVVSALNALLSNLSSEIGEATRERLVSATQVLLVALSIFLVSEALELPEFTGGLFRSVLATAAIVAVFATWYELAGNFVSILKTGEFQDVTLEADWTTRVTRFAIFIFGLTAILKVWNVDISGALTGVGVLGAGLAIAAQDLVRNLIAGMTNQSEARFVTGDAIEVDGKFLGTVKKIDLRSTLVVGFDQVPRHVPNADLSNSVVKNYSRMQHRRILISIPLVLSSSRDQIEKVRRDLSEFLKNSGAFSLDDDAPKYVNVSGISNSSIDIQFYAWTKSGTYSDYLETSERLALEVLETVARAGTALAYPTQTIHMAEHAGKS
ncbi:MULTISPECIES: mechanosensitive ion channel family protein [Ruegeria]|nr:MULTISPECIES: mechanosensitive ion channel family protein [Ruegeria]